jgi:UDP-2,3-diacylglucosamine pyrophosphatase LpxH
VSGPSCTEPAIHHHRSLFLSDMHLGSSGSRADLVLAFLKRNLAQNYVLVGDITDLGQTILSHWSPADQAVIDHLRARKVAGAELIYVRGNHDPDPEDGPADRQLPVCAVDHAIHVAADGRRYLVVHGDAQDTRLFQALVLTRLGSQIDRALRALDNLIGRYLHNPGPHRRSVIETVLSWVNWGLYPSRAHERRLVDLARERGFDGVICGHFHKAELHKRHGLIYANCGDWLDSFTALAADQTGHLHLLGGRQALASAARPTFQMGMART